MKSQIERMVRAMGWADGEMLAELAACLAAWGEAGGLVGHVLAAEHVWLARLERRAAAVPVWPTLSHEECARLAAENVAAYAAYLVARDDAGLQERVTYTNQRGEEYTTAVIDIVTHVVIHGAYHRGQIAKMVARLGASRNTDYIVWERAM